MKNTFWEKAMLNFITGVKNSSKTKKAHEVLGKCALEGKKTMLIVPKQFTFDTDRALLHLLGPKTASEIEVLSFSRLCNVAVTTYGGIKAPIAKTGMREVFMSTAVEGVRDSLKVFAKHKCAHNIHPFACCSYKNCVFT